MRISDVVAHAAARAPGAVALRFEGRAWSYRQLYSDICRLARGMLRVAEPGDRVAILAENTAEYVLSYYGVPLGGMVLVLVNYRLPPSAITEILADATPTVLITERKFLDTARVAAERVDSIRTVVCVDDAPPGTIAFAELMSGGPATEPAPPDEDAPAWLLYTSGTTGRAKGAMLTHRNLVAAVLNLVVSWDRGPERVAVSLCPWPLCHIAGYTVLVAHLQADAVVLMRRYEPSAFLAAIEQHRVTSMTVAPTMLALLLRHPSFSAHDTSSVTLIGYGSAAMPAATLREARRCFPRALFQTGFGMTELAGNVLVNLPDDHLAAARGEHPERLGSVGRPMMLSSVRVADEQGGEAPVDVVGELLVRGDQVCAGYWNRPDATTDAWRDGWFHSGDLARRDAAGYYYIVDRKKDMIVTGGENVYSPEVEDVVHRHPSVAGVAVIGVADELWGERVVAVIEPAEGRRPTEAEIREFCADRLAGYQCPRQVVIVDELPRNTVGKVLKRELRARLSST